MGIQNATAQALFNGAVFPRTPLKFYTSVQTPRASSNNSRLVSTATIRVMEEPKVESPLDGSDSESHTSPPFPSSHPNSFPEGGADAWLAVAGASACLFVSFGWVNCVGVFQEYYLTNQLQNYTPSQVSWIPSLQSLSSSS